jgi:hypothetical protein
MSLDRLPCRFYRFLPFGLVAMLAAPALAAPSACRRVPGAHLGWTHSGAFLGDRLVLADSTFGGLQILSSDSGSWSQFSNPGQGPLEFEKVLLVGGGTELVVSKVESLVVLASDLRPTRSFDFSKIGGEGRPGYFIQGVWNGEEGLGYLDVSAGGQGLETGVARVETSGDPTYQFIRLITRSSPEFSYYTSFPSFAAKLGDRLFWLTMATPAHVLEASREGGRKLDVVPAEWRVVPVIPAGGPGSTVLDYARRERQSFLAGLFGQGKELFILHRSALSAGRVRWQLAAVDPDHPERTRRLTLPTQSPWITLVPGPTVWALLEQGPVDGQLPSHQTTTSVLLLPSAWFSAPVSPLTRELKKDLCP